MYKYLVFPLLLIAVVVFLLLQLAPVQPAAAEMAVAAGYAPVFRFPVVPGSTISGYFDHNQAGRMVTIYNGKRNQSSGFGFIFSCPSVGMYDFVGCEDSQSGEGACSNPRELWYDGHRGIDMEYSPNWHTGALCDPGRFAGITSPVYAPARGKVLFAGYDPYRPGNGWHIRLKHDLNGNGNFDDDNMRSIYLHFTANALAVMPGQVVEEGQYLGLGGSTGYSSSPHLHFEVQRSNDYFQSTYWSVDPYGWQGEGADPWPYENITLWRRMDLDYTTVLPVVMNVRSQNCLSCVASINNGGFEGGHQTWVEDGVDVITPFSHPKLTQPPYAGDWLAWFGGRNNAEDQLYQAFSIAPEQTKLNFTYYLYMTTDETVGIYDQLRVRLRDANGSLLREVDEVNNTFSSPRQWVQRSITIEDVGQYAGQGLRLSFESSTDNSAVTSFYVDEVWLSGE